MKFHQILKHLKAKIQQTKTIFWFLTVFLSFVIFVALPAYPREKSLPDVYNAQVQVVKNCDDSNDDSHTDNPRAPQDTLIPYAIAPRRSFILSDKPKLRWNSILGVKSYTVSLKQGDKIIWKKAVKDNEVLYPGKPALKPGVEYLLIVKAENGKSSEEEKLTRREFRLLPVAETQVVKTAIAQINHKKVTDKAQSLLSAYIYRGAGLKSEAIEILEALLKSGIKEVAIYRQLGDLYWETGVSLFAEKNYKTGVKLATDIGEKAIISEALGNLYVAIGEKQEAIKSLTLARDSHKTLGNIQRVKELDEDISKL